MCGELYSEGFVYLTLAFEGKEFVHKFHVFKNLCCKCDGILGLDFISKYNGILDYELNIFSLKNNNERTYIPLQMGNIGLNNYLTVPPRSESIHFVSTSMNEDCVVYPSQLSEGVFMAGLVVSPVEK